MTVDRPPLVVRGGRVLDPDGELHRPPVADVLIEDGRIAAVGPGAGAGRDGAEVVDATGLLVAPGFVNAHYHSHDVLLRGLFEQLPLEIWGLFSFPQSYPRRSEAEVRLRTLVGAVECLRGGITTAQDMVTIVGPDRAHAEAVRDAYRESGLRVVLALQFGDRATVDTVPFWREDLPASVQQGLGSAIDPAPMQAFVEDLLDEPSEPGLTWGLAPSAPQRSTEGLLGWAAGLSAKRGLQVFTHVYEAKSQALLARLAYGADGGSLIGLLDRMGLLNPRLTIAHGVWIEDEEIARFGRAGAHLSFNPISNLKLLNGVAPVRRYADAGAGLAVGCDNCSASDAQTIFESMKMFALAWGLQSGAGEAGAAREAFRAATLGGASALGLAGEVGAVRPGFRADLTLLALDDPAFVPLNSAVRQLVYGASPRAVRTVMVGGEILVENGRPTRIEETRLAVLAEEARQALEADVAAVAERNGALVADLLRVHERIQREPMALDRYRLR